MKENGLDKRREGSPSEDTERGGGGGGVYVY